MSATEEVPEFLTPSLKLFLSVDLIGSTKLKHDEDVLNGQSASASSLDGVGAKWFNSLIDFYGEFELTFLEKWTSTFLDDSIVEEHWKETTSPSLWKINGDELIYVHNVRHPGEVVVALIAWREAVFSYRSSLKEKRSNLDLKATAWMAGFPIGNHEVAFWSDLSSTATKSEEPSGKTGQYYRLRKWYEDQSNARKSDYIKDYIGPAVDTGFRLAQFASARRFPVSIEIAYFLSKLTMNSSANKALRLRYLGREAMKGVLGGTPYPIFWLDCMSPNDELSKAEDELRPQSDPCSQDVVASYVEKFFADAKNKLFPPFIYQCEEKKFSTPPGNYMKLLEHIASIWSKEIRKHEIEIASEMGDGPEGSTPPTKAGADQIQALNAKPIEEKSETPENPKEK
ncbi:hypothetical protein HAD_02230 [Hyphomonas adhaerens MHS-3]|uniref:Uncharacterized protein n=1 Tax=Hyphomonas adhaerens MHS-3 TaxID=1280949 RepID=A0A069E3N8_9PROT|nr:hypothetical protein [Hyphomonas adhaerens]KCZ84459.1 hypothetical protein HAD_02230 [Hyphomonas adhaerens MHS-3]